MMTREEHKKVFFDFLKQHPSMKDLVYYDDTDTNVSPPRMVRLVVDIKETDTDDTTQNPPSYRRLHKSIVVGNDFIIFDPNYTNLISSFLQIDFNTETVNFIKDIVSAARTEKSYKTTIDLILEFFLVPLANARLKTKTIYVVTRDIKEWENDFWDDTITVQGTVEDFLGV